MMKSRPLKVNSVSKYHSLKGLPESKHPLISIVNYDSLPPGGYHLQSPLLLGFYAISIEKATGATYQYGKQASDFDDGLMFFMAPGQVFGSGQKTVHKNYKRSGWLLLIHPDFLYRTPLAKSIKKYEFFDYRDSEALFLSEEEEQVLVGIFGNIEQQYGAHINRHSQDIIIEQIEVLLHFSEQFYNRQFITRKVTNHQLLEQLEQVLNNYLKTKRLVKKGPPTVPYVSEQLNVSPSYLGNMLKVLTGQSTQEHIHDTVISHAKEKLSTTELTVGQIAGELGFEHPQSLSKLFKSKTGQSTLEFRRSFS